MALFGKKTAKPVRSGKEVKAASSEKTSSFARDLSHVLKHARITEKATMHSEQGVYTFEISERATKRDVSEAVRLLYKVTPRMVRVVPIPTKTRRHMRTGKTGVTKRGKKAYVYLKKGETLTIS